MGSLQSYHSKCRKILCEAAKRRQINDLSRSLAAFDPISTLVVVVEMSKASWLVSGVVPGVERQPLKKLEPDATALLRLIERWRNEAVRAGRPISRIALAYEAGRDGFWLARWLIARGIETHVIHSASVAVSRERKPGEDGSSGCGDVDARIPGLVAR
jgi:transposase